MFLYKLTVLGLGMAAGAVKRGGAFMVEMVDGQGMSVPNASAKASLTSNIQ